MFVGRMSEDVIELMQKFQAQIIRRSKNLILESLFSRSPDFLLELCDPFLIDRFSARFLPSQDRVDVCKIHSQTERDTEGYRVGVVQQPLYTVNGPDLLNLSKPPVSQPAEEMQIAWNGIWNECSVIVLSRACLLFLSDVSFSWAVFCVIYNH